MIEELEKEFLKCNFVDLKPLEITFGQKKFLNIDHVWMFLEGYFHAKGEKLIHWGQVIVKDQIICGEVICRNFYDLITEG